MKKVLFVIAPEGFRDEEFFEPKEILEKKYQVHIASIQKGLCKGKLGGTATADYDLVTSMRDIDTFAGVVFVGGRGAKVFADNKDAHRLIQLAVAKDKVLGAICFAPVILSHAGVLKGKKATCFPGDENSNEVVLSGKGALLQKEPVVVDGLIVTANGPNAATAFGKTLARVIA